jgi:hypothetical protein
MPGTAHPGATDAAVNPDATVTSDGGAPASAPKMVVACEPQGTVEYQWLRPSPGERQEYRGTNGTFLDSCDPRRNLVDYHCETSCPNSGGVNQAVCVSLTGKVVSSALDCHGECHDGRCESGCPKKDQRVSYNSGGPTKGISFTNLSDQRKYLCDLQSDVASDTFDCTTDAPAARTAVLINDAGDSRLRQGYFCTGDSAFIIALRFEGRPVAEQAGHHCQYLCRGPDGP